MSSNYSRNKGKRVRSSSTETNNSFVKSVTSRVSGLLPATITKWFSSPSSSSANGSMQPSESTDSSTDDEVSENPVVAQPPLKKMRLASNTAPSNYLNNSNNFNSIDIPNESFDTSRRVDSCNTFSVIQSPPGKSTFRRETNFVSTPLRAADDTPALKEDRPEKETKYFNQQLTVSQIGRSIEKKRKSLFSNERQSTHDNAGKSSMNIVKSPRQPNFKASLLGSPFYAGRTMYGGAASSLYMDQPNIKQTKVAVVRDSNTADNSMSHAARRVLDLLEHYASPLIEAKRIPNYTMTKLNDNSTSLASDSTMTDRLKKIQSYKTRELHVPSIASFIRVKQRSRLMDSTTAARQIIASQSSTAEFNPYPLRPQKDTEKEQNKLRTKLTSRITRPRRGEASEVATDIVAPIELPTGVLQINKDNLPKFSFAATIVSNSASAIPKLGTSSSPRTSTCLSATNEQLMNIENTNKDDVQKEFNANNAFQFASPIRISKEQLDLNSVSPNFIFGSPDRSIEKEKDKIVSSVVGEMVEKNKLSASKSNDWKCADCWVSNKSDVDKCVCCGGKRTSQEKSSAAKCSVCKIASSQSKTGKCITCEATTKAIENLPMNSVTEKWKCENCCLENDAKAEKCVGCGSKHSKPAIETIPQKNKASWRCDDCWVVNKSAADKCVACSAARPAGDAQPAAPAPAPAPATATSTPAKPASDTLFATIVKNQSEKWECSSCLVKNESNLTKCGCCDSPKPGSVKESQKKIFDFGAPNTTFKFGITPSNLSKTTITAVDTSTKPESETNNNNLSSTPNFSFGIPAKKTEGFTIEANFKFGQTSTVNEAESISKISVDAFKFSNEPNAAVNITTETNEKEAEQEVPKLLPETVQNPTPAAFECFSTTNAMQCNSDNNGKNSESENPLLAKMASAEKSDCFSSASEAKSSDPTNNNVKLSTAMNIVFTSPSTSLNPTTISFTTPLKPCTGSSIPATTLFPKNDTSKSASELVFSKSDNSAATATATPVFGFGSSSTSLSKSETIPKFNFKFGSSKSETTQMFNSSFGGGGGFSMPAGPPPGNLLSTATPNSTENLSNAANTISGNNLFGAIQKEHVWPSSSSSSNSNMIVSSSSSDAPQKPANFSFGPSATFGSSSLNPTSAFGNGPSNNALPAFGSAPTASPSFGSTQQVANSVQAFGSNPQPSNTMASFGSNQAPTGVLPSFGSSQSQSMASAFGQQTVSSAFGTGLQQSSIEVSPFVSQQNSIASPTFGQQNASSPFGSSAVAFGANVQPGSTPAPMFGTTNQAAANLFGISTPNMNNQPSMFSNPVQKQATSMFGSAAGSGQPTSMALFGLGGGAGGAGAAFGSPAAAGAPAFGASNTSITPFDTPAPAPAPAPTFNFGSPQNNGMFGFGQQQQAGVYNFGSTSGTAPQVQFNMGISTGSSTAAQNIASRRIRKPVRRTQR